MSNYKEKMNELRKKVGNYSDKESVEIKKIFKINKFYLFYLFPPIIILIILFIIKPSFICVDKKNDKKKIIFTKLLVSALIGGFIINICLWGLINKLFFNSN